MTKVVAGARFGWLEVKELLPNRKALCLCDCGAEKVVFRYNLPRGNTTSCGCAWYEKVSQPKKHGGCGSMEYRTWIMMKNRCLNPRARNFDYYGGRGVTISQEWIGSFEKFLADVGPRPTPSHSLDRIDNIKGYGPGNCVWATKKQQANNRRPRGTCEARPNI